MRNQQNSEWGNDFFLPIPIKKILSPKLLFFGPLSPPKKTTFWMKLFWKKVKKVNPPKIKK